MTPPTVAAFATALLELLAAFGVPFTSAQVDALTRFAGLLTPVVTWWLVRRAWMKAPPEPKPPAPPSSGAGGLGAIVLCALLTSCAAVRDASPLLSTADAVGRGLSRVLGWCDNAGADRSKVAEAWAAFHAKEYERAAGLAVAMVDELRASGAEVPEEVEILVRLVGAQAAQAIDDGMSALTGGE